MKASELNCLIVDESKRFIHKVEFVLQLKSCYKIYSANSLKDAQELLREHTFKLIIVSDIFRDGDPILFVRAVLCQSPGSKAVVCSSNCSSLNSILLRDAGINYYLNKNKVLEDLPGILTEVLRQTSDNQKK